MPRGRQVVGRLSPARLLAQVDAERRLGHEFVHEEAVRRVEAAAPRITEQALQLASAEHAGAAGDFHDRVDDPPAGLYGMIFGRDYLCWPCPAVVHALR